MRRNRRLNFDHCRKCETQQRVMGAMEHLGTEVANMRAQVDARLGVMDEEHSATRSQLSALAAAAAGDDADDDDEAHSARDKLHNLFSWSVEQALSTCEAVGHERLGLSVRRLAFSVGLGAVLCVVQAVFSFGL